MGNTANQAGNSGDTGGASGGTSGATMGTESTSLQQIMDPYGVMTAVFNAQTAWMSHPQELSQAMQAFFVDGLGFESHLLRIHLLVFL